MTGDSRKPFTCKNKDSSKEFKSNIITDEDYLAFIRLLVDAIKTKLNIDYYDFDEYIEYMRRNKIDSYNIFNNIVSNTSLTQLLNLAGIRDVPDRRKNPNGISKNRKSAKSCMYVIALTLIICSDYDCLRNHLKKESKVSDKQIRNIIKKFIPYLENINPYFDTNKWLPDRRRGAYTFHNVKKLVKKTGLKKTGKAGILKSPENKAEFESLAKKHKPSEVPLEVQCGMCGHIWFTNATRLQQKGGKWCIICAKGVYNYRRAKNLVETTGLNKTGKKGVLLSPKNEKEFNDLCKCSWPCRVSLKIKCGLCSHVWPTNVERLQQNHWCPECSTGEYEQICKWYLKQIISFILKEEIDFPKTRLSDIISHYEEANYTNIEKELIPDLIKYGHLDGYNEFILNRCKFKLGIEYNGGQHYIFVSKFHETIEDLKHQQTIDCLKIKLCKDNNINLIVFPYYVDEYMKDHIKIQGYIANSLKNHGIFIPIDLPQYNHNTPEFGQYRLDQYF